MHIYIFASHLFLYFHYHLPKRPRLSILCQELSPPIASCHFLARVAILKAAGQLPEIRHYDDIPAWYSFLRIFSRKPIVIDWLLPYLLPMLMATLGRRRRLDWADDSHSRRRYSPRQPPLLYRRAAAASRRIIPYRLSAHLPWAGRVYGWLWYSAGRRYLIQCHRLSPQAFLH